MKNPITKTSYIAFRRRLIAIGLALSMVFVSLTLLTAATTAGGKGVRAASATENQNDGLKSRLANDPLSAKLAADGHLAEASALKPATSAAPAPAFAPPNQLTADDGRSLDKFGRTVAISGDRVVIGAPEAGILHGGESRFSEQGEAYVFVRNGNAWIQEAKLVADEGIPEEFFGRSVAISGDTIVVGTRFGPTGRNEIPGAAYVFTRQGSTWTEQARLTASDAAQEDFFGTAVAISGNTIAVGADADDVGQNTDQGSVYIFTGSGNNWTQRAKLTAADGATGDGFGGSVALSGGTVLVGAARDDVANHVDQGSVYAFTGSGATWSQQAKIAAGDGAADDEFGSAVALDGETAVISNETDDLPANNHQGAAYVFVRTGATWSKQAKLKADDSRQTKLSAYSVAISGDTVLLGTYESNPNVTNSTQSGSVTVFVRAGTSWSQQARLTAGVFAPQSHRFGSAVAISGNVAFAGADGSDYLEHLSQGAAYAFARTSASRWQEVAKVVASDGAPTAQCGSSVAISGDTAVVGCEGDNNANTEDQGSAYVFIRSGTSWVQQAKLSTNDGGSFDEFGHRVAISGNTIVVGAAHKAIGQSLMQGAAYVFTRNGASWSQQARLTASDGRSYDVFGYSVAIEGDRIAIGAIDDHRFHPAQGSAYVFSRAGGTWQQTAKLIAPDGATNDLFGSAVAISGQNIAVGAQGDFSGPTGNKGAAYIFGARGSAWPLIQKVRGSDVAPNDGFGSRIALEGGTLLVGSMQDSIGSNQAQGSAYIFVFTGGRWIQRQKLTSVRSPSKYFGYSVSISGDTIVVGAIVVLGGSSSGGTVFVFRRNLVGIWLEEDELNGSDETIDDGFATSVAISGQTIVAGAALDDIGQNEDQGSAYFFIHRSGIGWTP